MNTDRSATDGGGRFASGAWRSTGLPRGYRTGGLTLEIALAVTVLLSTVLLLVLATTPAAAQPTAACNASPTEVGTNETITLDASGSTNASVAEFDVDGDGNYELTDDTDFVVATDYNASGTYDPVVRISQGPNETDLASCGAITVADNREPRAQLSAEPSNATVDESVELNASRSGDPDGSIVEYRFDVDDDGTAEYTTDRPTVEHAYDAAGTYRATVTVVDDGGANASAGTGVVVEPPAPVAACSVEPTTLAEGESLTIDATESEHATTVAVDADGDGADDRTLEEAFRTTVSFDTAGSYAPSVTARNDAGEDSVECGEVTVLAAQNASDGGAPGGNETAGGSGSAGSGSGGAGGIVGAVASALGVGDGGPGSPLHAGGTVLLLGAVGWLVGRVRRTGGDPRPRGIFEWRSDLGSRYTAGLLALGDGGTVTVDCGFRPDIVLLSARTDPDGSQSEVRNVGQCTEAAPQTTGGSIARSSGVALRTEDGIAQHALGVNWPRGDTGSERSGGRSDPAPHPSSAGEADANDDVTGTRTQSESGEDASSDPQGTATSPRKARDTGYATANGESLAFPGDEATARISTTTDDGFEIEAGGALGTPVSYRAVRLPADVELAVGSVAVPPGSDRGELPTDRRPDALLIDAVGTTEQGDCGVASSGAAWSTGTAGDHGERQTAVGGDCRECVTADDRAIELGPDGTAARFDPATGQPALRYDAPADDHVCQFVGLSGPQVRHITTGSVDLTGDERPAATELAVGVGFRPAFFEFWIVQSLPSDDAPARAGGGAAPLSAGVALAEEDGVEQVVLHGRGTGDGTAPVQVAGLSEDGIRIRPASWLGQDGDAVWLVYRAWPPVSDRDGGGAVGR